MTSKPKSVHTLKITLREVKPPVWRRMVVDSYIRLDALAGLLEAAMGWYGGHLHQFETTGARYGEPDPEWGDDMIDERKARLADALPNVKSKLRWDYDFGDGWEHDVVVEAIGPPPAGVSYPLCVAGKRACPPEDCGGVWGYGDLLEALADPSHEDHADLTEWAPSGFDPEHFDVDETTEAMRTGRPLEDW